MSTLGHETGSSRRPHPWVWSVLYFPFGLTFGFPSIALGYLASRAGVPVGAIAGVVGMTWLASGWKFVWAPLGDYTLDRKRWYLIAISVVSVGFVTMTLVPLTPAGMPVLAIVALLTSLAGTFIAFATEGLMTHNTDRHQRGRAGGWFQSGNQFGQTAGGGLGLWLMQHTPSPWMAWRSRRSCGAAPSRCAGSRNRRGTWTTRRRERASPTRGASWRRWFDRGPAASA
jgi:MFS family permease